MWRRDRRPARTITRGTRQVRQAEDEVGDSKVRKGRWLGANVACPDEVADLYHRLLISNPGSAGTHPLTAQTVPPVPVLTLRRLDCPFGRGSDWGSGAQFADSATLHVLVMSALVINMRTSSRCPPNPSRD